jgi:hypothetical protein
LVGYTLQVGTPGRLPLLAALPLACVRVCGIIWVNLSISESICLD